MIDFLDKLYGTITGYFVLLGILFHNIIVGDEELKVIYLPLYFVIKPEITEMLEQLDTAERYSSLFTSAYSLLNEMLEDAKQITDDEALQVMYIVLSAVGNVIYNIEDDLNESDALVFKVVLENLNNYYTNLEDILNEFQQESFKDKFFWLVERMKQYVLEKENEKDN